MFSLHPQFILDETRNVESVVIPIEEWEQILEVLEDLDDICAYEAAVNDAGEALPFDQAIQEIRLKQKS